MITDNELADCRIDDGPTNPDDFQVTEFDIPANAQYGGLDIISAGYNHTLNLIYMLHDTPNEMGGWAQLIFHNCEWTNGSPILNHNSTPVGIMAPERAVESDTPGGDEAEELYNLLEDLGVKVF